MLIAVGVMGPILAAVVLRVFVVEAFKIPSGSMTPTLEVGDHLLVTKGDKTPLRGEVVVFEYPENRTQDFVSRVAAVGGDTLEVLDGRPVVNGVLAPQCYVGKQTVGGNTRELYIEKLGGVLHGALHTVRSGDKSCSTSDDCANQSCNHGICVTKAQGPYTVAPGEFWLLGDNRDNSHDSRMWNGTKGAGVPLDHVVGKAWFLFAATSAGRAGGNVQGLPRLGGDDAGLQSSIDKCVAELSKSP